MEMRKLQLLKQSAMLSMANADASAGCEHCRTARREFRDKWFIGPAIEVEGWMRRRLPKGVSLCFVMISVLAESNVDVGFTGFRQEYS